MNDAVRNLPRIRKDSVSEAEWNARVDLAAAYRLVDIYGWHSLIYNHIALRVPGEPECFLMKAHSLLFHEVCASTLVKLRLDGRASGWSDNVNAAGFTIHSAVLRARPDINCTLHIHTVAGTAMSAHPEGLLPLSQNAMRFYNRLSYHDFEGVATDLEECERLARDLGPKNKAMILRNHGLLTCGATPAETMTAIRNLVEACETQLMLQAAGKGVLIPSPEVCEHSARQYEQNNAGGGDADWPAYLRVADRADPSYRT
jgi:ribulose-5-phosphate 4-epimerase/fuculose-1-phosphate aldolase